MTPVWHKLFTHSLSATMGVIAGLSVQASGAVDNRRRIAELERENKTLERENSQLRRALYLPDDNPDVQNFQARMRDRIGNANERGRE